MKFENAKIFLMNAKNRNGEKKNSRREKQRFPKKGFAKKTRLGRSDPQRKRKRENEKRGRVS